MKTDTLFDIREPLDPSDMRAPTFAPPVGQELSIILEVDPDPKYHDTSIEFMFMTEVGRLRRFSDTECAVRLAGLNERYMRLHQANEAAANAPAAEVDEFDHFAHWHAMLECVAHASACQYLINERRREQEAAAQETDIIDVLLDEEAVL